MTKVYVKHEKVFDDSPEAMESNLGAPVSFTKSTVELDGKVYPVEPFEGWEVSGHLFNTEKDAMASPLRNSMDFPSPVRVNAVKIDGITLKVDTEQLPDIPATTTEGLDLSDPYTVYSPDIDYEGNNPWQKKAPLPEARYGMGIASMADIIYIIGGNSSSTGNRNILQYFHSLFLQ